jgi:hypothetical protein
MGEGLSDTTIRRSRPPATAKGCSTTPISRTPSHRVRTPQEANGRTDFVALLTKRGGAQATLVAFDLLRSAGIRDVDCGDNSTASVDAKRAAIQSQARFTQLSCAGDATRSEKPPAAHRGRGFRFRISPLLCAILSFREDFKRFPDPRRAARGARTADCERRGHPVQRSARRRGRGHVPQGELGLEGIVSKRRGSFYKSGRSRNWLKTVNPDSVRTRPPAARLRNFRVAPSVFVRAVVERVTTLCRARVRALRAR